MARSLYLRRVPPELRAELTARATDQGISVSEYVVGILEEVASRPPIADVLRRAGDRGDAGEATTADVVAIIRRTRDAQ